MYLNNGLMRVSIDTTLGEWVNMLWNMLYFNTVLKLTKYFNHMVKTNG